MKKMIKLSLVAAVAVAGLTTSATAGSLENAIKDTTISGKALIGYNYKKTTTAGVEATSNQTEYDLDITMTTKVNDTISFTTGIEADHDLENRDVSTDAGKGSEIGLTKAYFTAKTDVATVMIGKQKQPTPFLDDERGDGVVALVPAGPVTIAAGHFTGMNGGASLADTAGADVVTTTSNWNDANADSVIDAGEVTYSTTTVEQDNLGLNLAQRDISALAIIAAAGPVNIQAWYLMASGSDVETATMEDGLDGYSLNLSGKFGPVNVELNHASLAINGSNGYNFDDETLTKLVVSGAVSGVNLVAGYGMTNDANHNLNGTLTTDTRLHGVDLTSDDDAKTNFSMDQIRLDNFNDADALLLGASMTFGQTTVGANYLMATKNADTAADADIDATELDLTVSYAMSKNFSITGLYSTATYDFNTAGTADNDDDRMELSLNYKF